MATVKVTNLKNVTSAIKKQIVKASRDKSIRLGIGELVVSDIQATTFRTTTYCGKYPILAGRGSMRRWCGHLSRCRRGKR